MFFVDIVSNEYDLDSNSYNEVNFEKDSENWQSAIKVKIESMCFNHIWELVKLPINVKSIDCKWIYKSKSGPDSSI